MFVTGDSYRRASEFKKHTVNCDEADVNCRGKHTVPKVKTLQTRFSVRRKVFTHKFKELIKSKVTKANVVKSPVRKVKTAAKRDNSELDNSELDNSELDNSELDNSELDNSELDNSELDNSELDNSELELEARNGSGIKNTAKASAQKGWIENVSVNVKTNSSKSRNDCNDDLKMKKLLEKKPYYNCQHCDYHSAFESNICAHINAAHKSKVTKVEPVQNCYQCKRVFQNSMKFKAHIQNGKCKVMNCNISVNRLVRKTEKLDTLFECLECDYKSPYTHCVRSHMKIKHNVTQPKIHRCKFCLEMFPTLSILKKHMGVSFCVNTNSEYAQQVREAEENKCYYNCLKCGYLSAYKYHVRKHMQVIHKIADPKFYSCKSCGETFGTVGLLFAHMKTCSGQNAKDLRNKTKIPIRNQIYVCEKCGENFDDKNRFDGHKEFTNCKKRKKMVSLGELFGEAKLPPTVENIDNIETLTGVKRKHFTKKVTEKNDITGKRPAGRIRSYQSRKRFSNNKKSRENDENRAPFTAIYPQKPRQLPPVTVTFETIKKEPEAAVRNFDADIEPKPKDDIAEQENFIIEEKPILSHQYLSAEPEHFRENDCNGSDNYIVDTIESVGPIKTEEPIEIEMTVEVEGPFTDSENYYIFDALSYTYVPESENFMVAGTDGVPFYGDLEIVEDFNMDLTSTTNDYVYY